MQTPTLKTRLTAIRAIRHKAGMDDDVYRALLQRVIGVTSSTQIKDLTSANRVLSEFRRLGLGVDKKQDGKPKNEWAFVFRMTPTRQLYGRKIFRLAQQLGPFQTPAVPVASKAYVEGIANQMASCTTALEFCDEERLHNIVIALQAQLDRYKKRAF
jgi:phage gp16-like protein